MPNKERKWEKTGKILASLRAARGFSQTECVDALNAILAESENSIVLKTYQQYEQGRQAPKAEYLIALSEMYQVSIDFLLGRADLDASANHTISVLKSYDTNQTDAMKVLPELNFLLSDPAACVGFLYALKNYRTQDFSVPLYRDENGNLHPSTDQIDGRYLQQLARDKNDLDETIQFVYSEDSLKAIALRQMERAIVIMLENAPETPKPGPVDKS